MRFNLHRRRTLGEIKAELRTIMIDYEISEAYLDSNDKLDRDDIRPKHVSFYYFFPLGEYDFDYREFDRKIDEVFHGQVSCDILSAQDTFIKLLRKMNVTPF